MYGMSAFQVLRSVNCAAEWFRYTKANFFRMILRI